MRQLITLFFIAISCTFSFSQEGKTIDLNYKSPSTYIIKDIIVSGAKTLDKEALVALSGFQKGDEIRLPSDKVGQAIKNIWKQRLVDNVAIKAAELAYKQVNIYIEVTERPRLSGYIIQGVKKGVANDIGEEISLLKGAIVSPALIKNTRLHIQKYFLKDGYYNAKVNIEKEESSLSKDYVKLRIDVDRGKKVKIEKLRIIGNKDVEDKKLIKQLKKTRQRKPFRVFHRSKFIEKEFKEDKEKLIDYYRKNGYRDARILKDSVDRFGEKRINLDLQIYEGKKYYFGEISWSGNYIYETKKLKRILNIKKGEIYNKELLDTRLNYNPTGQDVSSLYLDNGYLFFSANPVEVGIQGDTVDIEMRIYEGKQATINNIIINGNTKTSDHVVLREIRTLPGQKFSRSELIRTQRELAQLGYFDPEQMGINPIPNPKDGTVDIEYTLVEKPNDQLQLSGGFGGFVGFVGTLGIVFNNFSLRNIPNKELWSPLPSGDGQRLSLQMRANGKQFQNYSISFTEPWLGGRKPNSFTVSFNRSVQRRFTRTGDVVGFLKLTGASVSLGRRLRVPDDYFTLTNTLSYYFYNLDNFGGANSLCTTCKANNLSLTTTLSRNNIGTNPQFPTRGGSTSLAVTLTPPYSLINRDRETLSELQKNDWIEYHKWMFDNSLFMKLTGNKKSEGLFAAKKTSHPLVLNIRTHVGFIGSYNNKLGIGPFERFTVGGDGLSGFNFLLGSDVIGLRGYGNNSLPNNFNAGDETGGGVAYDKFVAELRFPLVTEGVATIFVLGFLEAGNAWRDFKDFNPFETYRSAGVGARIFMPAFGMIGIDYGYGFDELNDVNGNSLNRGQFHFTIGQQLR
ncbi:MAG: outer membrane protein assembly factor BamA [Cyclobacteriaceae bacterium]